MMLIMCEAICFFSERWDEEICITTFEFPTSPNPIYVHRKRSDDQVKLAGGVIYPTFVLKPTLGRDERKK